MTFETYREFFMKNCLMKDCKGNLTRPIWGKVGNDFYVLMEKYGIENKTHFAQMLRLNIQEIPKCKTCGKTLEKDIRLTYCSSKCMANDPEVLQKREKTSMEKYGVKNAGGSKEAIEKAKQTKLDNNGGSHEEEIRQRNLKTKQTQLEKYGSEKEWKKVCSERGKEIMSRFTFEELSEKGKKGTEKRQKTNLEKYGTEYSFNINPSLNSLSKPEKEISLLIKKDFEILTLNDGKINYFFNLCYENKIIEYYENNLNANPLMYKNDHIFKRNGKLKVATEIWLKNKKIIEVALSKGYEVYIVWENEFKYFKDKTIEELMKFLDSSKQNTKKCFGKIS